MPRALPGAEPFPAALRARLAAALARRERGADLRTRHLRSDGLPVYTNRLVLETSPYLQQHAHNPVDWRPWGEEAFRYARERGRPVLVSIGYSTCHWCHVMERESFDDPAIAEELNAHFVAIKVDREARPDVDAVYMQAIHALGASGGWPLNVWVTPDGKPFHAGTYFPPEDRGGRPGLRTVLAAIRHEWETNRAGVAGLAERLTVAVRRDLEALRADALAAPAAEPLHRAFERTALAFDPTWGGVGRERKFPSNTPIRFLLRYYRRTGEPRALAMASRTLEKMAAGGIHDQIGGGFHRYATDRRWLVPHFEKMLYDNALRVLEYVEAWQATGRSDFAAVARDTLGYVAREMTLPGGGFASATDADSPAPGGEREEGRFFTWTPAEIEAALPPREAAAAIAFWGVTAAGQLDGRSVLHAWRERGDVARELGVDESDFGALLERAARGLRAARSRRAPPARDEKVLAAWNGLMISAFARAGLALGEPAYVAAAERAADFVLGSMPPDGRLRRVIVGGRAAGPAFLDDHAFLIAGLLDLYESAARPRWLREALALQAQLDARYADEEGGGYFQTAGDHERLLARGKPSRDGAIPSGNSVEAENLLRLAELTGDSRLAERAQLLLAAFRERLARAPEALPELLLALDRQLDAPREVVIVAPAGGGGGVERLLAPLRRSFAPNLVLARVREGADLERHAAVVPLVEGKRARDGRATAYVCESRVCRLPTSDPEVFAEQLSAARPLPGGPLGTSPGAPAGR